MSKAQVRAKVRALRSVDLGFSDLDNALRFFTEVWNLTLGRRKRGRALSARDLRLPPHPHHPPPVAAGADPHGARCRRPRNRRRSARPSSCVWPENRRSAWKTAPAARRLRLRLQGSGRPQHRGGLRRAATIPTPPTDPTGRASFPTSTSIAATAMQRSLAIATRSASRSPTPRARLRFLSCNTDHHSMVLGFTGGPTLNHIAFEMPDLEFGDARRRPHARQWPCHRMGTRPPRPRQQRVLLFPRTRGHAGGIDRRDAAD